MKKVLIIILILSLAGVSLIPFIKDQSRETTDAVCVKDCTQRGFEAAYCKTRCDLDQDAQAAAGRTSDHQCMSSCENAGRPHDYCVKTCTY